MPLNVEPVLRFPHIGAEINLHTLQSLSNFRRFSEVILAKAAILRLANHIKMGFLGIKSQH